MERGIGGEERRLELRTESFSGAGKVYLSRAIMPWPSQKTS